MMWILKSFTTCTFVPVHRYKTLLGGNIGTPILDLNINKTDFLVIDCLLYTSDAADE